MVHNFFFFKILSSASLYFICFFLKKSLKNLDNLFDLFRLCF